MTNNPNEQILSKPLIDNDFHLHLILCFAIKLKELISFKG